MLFKAVYLSLLIVVTGYSVVGIYLNFMLLELWVRQYIGLLVAFGILVSFVYAILRAQEKDVMMLRTSEEADDDRANEYIE